MRILLRRFAGGFGDQLCCLPALACTRELYPKPHEVIYAVGQPYYGLVYRTAIQHYHADEAIAPPGWADHGDAGFVAPFELNSFDRVIDLTNEVEYAHAVNWNIQKSRQEIWCDQVIRGYTAYGRYPTDMSPRILIDPKARHQFVNGQMALSGLRPFDYVVVHWKSNEVIKDYPHNASLIEALRDQGRKVVVAHNDPVPSFSVDGKPVWVTSGLSAQVHAMMLEMAQAVICPDSFILHLAAAVNCPTVALFSSTNGAVTCKHYPFARVMQNSLVQGKPCEKMFPCYGLYGGRRGNGQVDMSTAQSCWCLTREEEEKREVPWCLEQVGHNAVIAMLDTTIATNQSNIEERRKRVMTELDEASVIRIDRKKYLARNRKPLVVGVPPGIGDSLWAMVKVQDIMKQDGADDLIVCMQETKPARGLEFIQRLDFVAEPMYKSFGIHQQGEFFISGGRYNYAGGDGGAMRKYMGMDWLLIPNRPLERGEPLDSWLPEYRPNWDVMKDHFRFLPTDNLIAEKVASKLKNGWVTFFLGGISPNGMMDEDGKYHTTSGKNRARRYSKREWDSFGYKEELWRPELDVRPIWLIDYWVDLARMIVEEQGLGVVVVGAPWVDDESYAGLFMKHWEQSGGDPAAVLNIVGETGIAECLRVTMGGRCLVSFQSGIGVASEYLGVNTAIFWRADGDSEEAPPDGNEGNIGRQFVSLSEDMRNAWSPTWAANSHIGLVYGRETPREIYDQMISRNWFSVAPSARNA